MASRASSSSLGSSASMVRTSFVVTVRPPTTLPPSIEDLFKEAARNHELERAYRSNALALTRPSSRRGSRPPPEARRGVPHRPDAARDGASGAHAEALLHGHRQRSGDVRRATDVGPARDVPARGVSAIPRRSPRPQGTEPEAPSRASRPARGEDARHRRRGSPSTASEDQRGRHAAGLLARRRSDRRADRRGVRHGARTFPGIRSDGASRLQEHLRAVTGRSNIVGVGQLTCRWSASMRRPPPPRSGP